MSASIVITQMVILFILIFAGYLMTKLKMVDMTGSRQLSAIVSNITNPALIISGAFTQDGTITNHDILIVSIVSLVLFFIWFLVGKGMGYVLRVPKHDRDYYVLMTMFGNSGFIGLPIIIALLGSQYAIYVAVYNLFFNLIIYTYGVYLLSKHGDGGKKSSWKSCINTGTISAILTMVIFCCKIQVPTIVEESIRYMGNATTFLALFIVGISLAQASLKEIFKDVRLYPFILIRQLILPIIVALVLKYILPDVNMRAVMVVLSAVPVGNLAFMLARARNQEAEVLSKGIILTTICSIITIPIVCMFI